MIVLKSHELLPRRWRNQCGESDAYVFNPSVVRFRNSLLLAYRVVLPDLRRRIAICRLTDTLSVIEGTAVPLSDYVRSAGEWHADPRFCIYGDRLLIHFNNGIPQRGNSSIFVIELDPDALQPRGPARPLLFAGARPVEKNWMLLEHESGLYAIYTISPHTVLRLQWQPGGESAPIDCQVAFEVPWNDSAYAGRFGDLRGGSSPVRHQGRFYTFFHSARSKGMLRGLIGRTFGVTLPRRVYTVGFYGFQAAPPFSPEFYTPLPVLPSPRLPRLHRDRLDRGVLSCVYPGGAVLRDGAWLVAFGVQNEYCCLDVLSHSNLMAAALPCELVRKP